MTYLNHCMKFCTLSPLKSRQDEDQARSEIKNDRFSKHSRWCFNGINSFLLFMPLWRVCCCQLSIVYVYFLCFSKQCGTDNLNPQTIICDFEISLIPLC
ncbi:hypothetical protein T03_777 [Trichinella britovi]|uniref:Uncharacterized protein n=1 Tax=Trichinella britovi TaxID=45882 RepID=A0A0V1CLT8_TRIBR|nr:hypothetical protein T03_777 [Trichinella britovi]